MTGTVENYSAASGIRAFIHCLRGGEQTPFLYDKPGERVPCMSSGFIRTERGHCHSKNVDF